MGLTLPPAAALSPKKKNIVFILFCLFAHKSKLNNNGNQSGSLKHFQMP